MLSLPVPTLCWGQGGSCWALQWACILLAGDSAEPFGQAFTSQIVGEEEKEVNGGAEVVKSMLIVVCVCCLGK